jgi:hypothetical protein
MKAFGECHWQKERKAKWDENEHLSRHFRDGCEIARTQVHEGVYGEDHERHGKNHVGCARIPTCHLADRDDHKPCDYTVDNEFDHGCSRPPSRKKPALLAQVRFQKGPPQLGRSGTSGISRALRIRTTKRRIAPITPDDRRSPPVRPSPNDAGGERYPA